jgi:hypothetical protein
MARDRIRKPIANFPEMLETSQSLAIYLPSAHHQSIPVESRTARIPGARFVQGAVPNMRERAASRCEPPITTEAVEREHREG